MRTSAKWLKCLFPFVAVPLFVGCQNTALEPEGEGSLDVIISEPAPISGYPILVISPGELELAVGEFLQLERIWEDGGVTYDDPSKDVQWIVENPTIAAVTKDGLIEGLREGMTRITAVNEEGTVAAFLRVESR